MKKINEHISGLRQGDSSSLAQSSRGLSMRVGEAPADISRQVVKYSPELGLHLHEMSGARRTPEIRGVDNLFSAPPRSQHTALGRTPDHAVMRRHMRRPTPESGGRGRRTGKKGKR